MINTLKKRVTHHEGYQKIFDETKNTQKHRIKKKTVSISN